MMRFTSTLAVLVLALLLAPCNSAFAQANVNRIALKSGESTEMGKVYWIIRPANCRSTLEKLDGVDVLESPPNVKVELREEMVKPVACPNKVPGATVVVSVTDVEAPTHGTLIYRVKYKTRDGDRTASWKYRISLYP